MSYPGGINWVAVQKALYDWVLACTGVSKIIWGGQKGFRPTQNAIVLRLSFLQDGRSWMDHEVNYLTFNDIVITAVDDTANTLTKVAHGLLTGDGPVRMTGSDLPAGLLADTDYWVIKVDADKVKLATGFVNAMAGTAIDLTDAGSGTITLVDTAVTLRAAQEILYKARSVLRAILTVECYTGNSDAVGLDMAQAILWRLEAKRKLPSVSAILEEANIGLREVTQIKAYGGTQDLVIFEPRAMVDVHLLMVSEDSEFGTIIERTEITDETHSNIWTVDAENPP